MADIRLDKNSVSKHCEGKPSNTVCIAVTAAKGNLWWHYYCKWPIALKNLGVFNFSSHHL